MFEGVREMNGMLILYDCVRKKLETYTEPLGNICVVGTCWEVVEISDKEIKIKYPTESGDKVINFQRT